MVPATSAMEALGTAPGHGQVAHDHGIAEILSEQPAPAVPGLPRPAFSDPVRLVCNTCLSGAAAAKR